MENRFPRFPYKTYEHEKGQVLICWGICHRCGTRGQYQFFLYWQSRDNPGVPGPGSLNVEMSEKGTMAEVIFTGYQTIDKKKFAGASVALKFDDIKMSGVTGC